MNNQSFNDAIKVAGIIVPIVTALIGLATAFIRLDTEQVNNLNTLFSSGSSETPGNTTPTDGTQAAK